MARKPIEVRPVIAPVIADAHAAPSVTNTKPGTVLHLGDGRKLAFGESAEVSAELAALLAEGE